MNAIVQHGPFALSRSSQETGGMLMKGDIPIHAIPTAWAAYLCQDICRESANQRFSLARRRCARCQQLYPFDVTRRGFARREDNRGCPFINAREAHYYWAFHG